MAKRRALFLIVVAVAVIAGSIWFASWAWTRWDIWAFAQLK